MLGPQNTRHQPLYGGGHNYAQTISRATNLHYINHQPRTSNPFVAPPNPLQCYYDPTSLSMSPQDHRNLMIQQQQQQQQQQRESLMSVIDKQALLNRPLCRCRVMYLGSSVPHITKNGLHGIQEPLKHLYPEEQFSGGKLAPGTSSAIINPAQQANASVGPQQAQPHQVANNTIDISHLSSSLGIDSWLSVWSNGLLLENVDEFGRDIKRFFSIESLHYCAAVRFFDTTTLMQPERDRPTADPNNNTILNSTTLPTTMVKEGSDQPSLEQLNNPAVQRQQQQHRQERKVRFLPLDAPLFQCSGMVDANHPPVFAAILRRTTGIKVLECHAFICRRDAAANALVRCCTHAYADFLSAKRLSMEFGQTIPGSNEYRGTTTSRRLHHHTKRPTSLSSAKLYSSSSCYDGTITTEATVNCINGNNANDNLNNNISNRNHSVGNSNEDNSLETSSEDNYAIISKHHHQRQNQQQVTSGVTENGSSIATNAATSPVSGNNLRKVVKQRNSREKHRVKNGIREGSSKSLYSDFMPKTSGNHSDATGAGGACCSGQQQQQQKSSSRDMEKLSHSLDLLDMGTCCGDDNSVQYSVSKNKRHSKSMQNLEGPFEFSARSAQRSSSKLARRSGRHLRREQRVSEKSRKAASFQDIIAAPRKNSISSDMTVHSFASTHNQPPICGSCNTQDSGAYVSDPQPPPPSIKRVVDRDHSGQQILVSSRQDSNNNNVRAMSSRSRKSSVKSRREHANTTSSRSRQRDSLAPHHFEPPFNHHLSSQAQPTTTNGAYYQQMATFNGKAHPGLYHASQHHHHLTASIPYPMSPYYLPMATYHPHQPHHLYPSTSGSIYESMSHPAYLQAPPALAHHHPHQPQHPQQQQYTATHTNAGIVYANSGANTAAAASTLAPRRKKSAKSSLARFRCLSPPVNFLIGTVSKQTGSGALNPGTNEDSNPAVDNSGGSQVQADCGSEPQPVVDVVSAQPGFISSATIREKKMSWIKRLSLTMTAGTSDDSDTGGLSTDPSGLTQRTQRKKRSSLFSGSLTLGRNRQHAKLITSP